MILEDHMKRQMEFSIVTFGPGERTNGVCDHIEKELVEIKENPDDGLRSREWVDVVLLSLDGLWRSLQNEGEQWENIPNRIVELIEAKQTKNELRDWPDWKTMPTDKAITHIKS